MNLAESFDTLTGLAFSPEQVRAARAAAESSRRGIVVLMYFPIFDLAGSIQ